MDAPFAVPLRPTLSMALSRARPIRNSRDKSDNLSRDSLSAWTVFFPYSKVAFGRQKSGAAGSCSIQSRGGLESREQCQSRQHWRFISDFTFRTVHKSIQLVAVEQGPGESGFNMSNDFSLYSGLGGFCLLPA